VHRTSIIRHIRDVHSVSAYELASHFTEITLTFSGIVIVIDDPMAAGGPDKSCTVQPFTTCRLPLRFCAQANNRVPVTVTLADAVLNILPDRVDWRKTNRAQRA